MSTPPPPQLPAAGVAPPAPAVTSLPNPDEVVFRMWMGVPASPKKGAKLISGPAPEVPRVLVVSPEDVIADVPRLLSAAEELEGSVVVTLSPSRWEEVHGQLAEAVGIAWAEERSMTYEPPWFVDKAKVAHLIVPLRICEAAGGRRLMVCICDPLDGSLSAANVGSFSLVWDRGGFCGAASSDDRAKEYVRKLLGLMLPGGRLLLAGAERGRPSLEQLRGLCGPAALVHGVGGLTFAMAGAPPPPPVPPSAVADGVPYPYEDAEGSDMLEQGGELFMMEKRKRGVVQYRQPACPCCA